MSVVSQRFSRTSNAGGAPTRENNVVSLGGTIGARGLPPGPDLRPYKSLTCSDAMRTGPNGRHRGLLRLTECSHHVGSSGVVGSLLAERFVRVHYLPAHRTAGSAQWCHGDDIFEGWSRLVLPLLGRY
jgi:hypothetical protein